MKDKITSYVLLLMMATWIWTLIEFAKFIIYDCEVSPYSWRSLLIVMSGGILYLFIMFPPEKEANTT